MDRRQRLRWQRAHFDQCSVLRDDIPESLAYAAHSGTSHVPNQRAKQKRSANAQSLRGNYVHFRHQAEQGGTLELLDAEFARYRERLSAHTRAHLESRSRCLSPMISGPANFPVARNRKRFQTADKRREELLDFRKCAGAAILRTLHAGLQPIRVSDADALERLRRELPELEGALERMKAANITIRKHRQAGTDAQIAALGSLGFEAGYGGRVRQAGRPWPKLDLRTTSCKTIARHPKGQGADDIG